MSAESHTESIFWRSPHHFCSQPSSNHCTCQCWLPQLEVIFLLPPLRLQQFNHIVIKNQKCPLDCPAQFSPEQILGVVFIQRMLNSADKYLPYVQYWEEEPYLPPAILRASSVEQLTKQMFSTLPFITTSTVSSGF